MKKMNLKMAGKYSNVLKDWLGIGTSLLKVYNDEDMLRFYGIVQLHKKSTLDAVKYVDETQEIEKNAKYNMTAEVIVKLLLDIVEEKAKIDNAIELAKKQITISGLTIDVAKQDNKRKRTYLDTLSELMNKVDNKKNSVGTISVVNVEGNRADLAYPIEETRTLCYDKSEIRKLYTKIAEEVEDISNSIDKELTNIIVEFTPKYVISENPFSEAIGDNHRGNSYNSYSPF